MDKNRKTTLMLIVMIFIMLVVILLATYSYLMVREKYEGSFNVQIETKGVDILQIQNIKEGEIIANVANFGKQFADVEGYNLTDDSQIQMTLSTTNDSVEICYKPEIELNNNIVINECSDNEINSGTCKFCNSLETKDQCREKLDNSSLLNVYLNVYKSEDGNDFSKVLENYDITTKNGLTKEILEDTTYKISTSRDIEKKVLWKAELVLDYKNYDQSKNDGSKYSAKLNITTIDC